MMSPSQAAMRGPGRPVGEASGAGRAALLAAARELMAERGLAGLTSKAVAERAGLRPTLVNYYFGDRRGLLRALVAEISSDLNADVLEALADPGPVDRRLKAVIERILLRFAEEPHAARLFFEQVLFADDEAIDHFADQYGRSQSDALRSVLEEGMRQGRYEEADLEMAVVAIGGLCIFLGAATPLIARVMDIEPLTRESAPDFAERATTLILNGLMKPSESGR